MPDQKYCEDIFAYRRRPTHAVMVGEVGVGGDNPIRIQSMTIADTLDTDATVREVAELARAGCEIVRITAPSIKEAENLREIKRRLRTEGIRVPLVADIHFTPNAALVAAEIVEKVRINPGNYADKKKFEVREYTDAEYAAELDRIRDRFAPLVQKCKTNGVAMRVGVNHGSLSDRVMNRYGDTPEGMVQSALEFLTICEDFDYRAVVISMKSSNPQVMIQAYRLLAARLYELGMTYPFHLGVTEAGDGEDGRIKSAVGIGALLEDGIGDTIRVSLTEDAIYEVPVARALAEKYNRQHAAVPATPPVVSTADYADRFPPFTSSRFATYRVNVIGAAVGQGEPVRVAIAAENLSRDLGKRDGNQLRVLAEPAPESSHEWCFAENGTVLSTARGWLPVARPWQNSGEIATVPIEVSNDGKVDGVMLFSALRTAMRRGAPLYLGFWGFTPAVFSPEKLRQQFELIVQTCTALDYWQILFGLTIPAAELGALGGVRQAMTLIAQKRFNAPIVLHYPVPQQASNWQLDAAATLGALLADGIGNAIYISGAVPASDAVRFSYTLLQATRLRISKTEFISCPSCGRTLFNLQTTTERIKAKTGHLKGVKIAIMGCIVNGPGEMADADFGYVGAGVKKVNLFVGKECVERNIPEAEADARLIELIKRHGKWVDP